MCKQHGKESHWLEPAARPSTESNWGLRNIGESRRHEVNSNEQIYPLSKSDFALTTGSNLRCHSASLAPRYPFKATNVKIDIHQARKPKSLRITPQKRITNQNKHHSAEILPLNKFAPPRVGSGASQAKSRRKPPGTPPGTPGTRHMKLRHAPLLSTAFKLCCKSQKWITEDGVGPVEHLSVTKKQAFGDAVEWKFSLTLEEGPGFIAFVYCGGIFFERERRQEIRDMCRRRNITRVQRLRWYYGWLFLVLLCLLCWIELVVGNFTHEQSIQSRRETVAHDRYGSN